MTIRELLVGNMLNTFKYPGGLLNAIIDELLSAHVRDIEHESSHVVDHELVTDAVIDRFLADGWCSRRPTS